MSAETKLDHILEGDIDEVADWGANLAEERRASALEETAQLAFAALSPPALQIKALALMQAILLNPAPLDPTSAGQCIERIAKHIETTNHSEVQHTCGKVLAVLLARVETISDETFDNAVSLLRCMKRVAVFPFAREFYDAALSRAQAIPMVQWACKKCGAPSSDVRDTEKPELTEGSECAEYQKDNCERGK